MISTSNEFIEVIIKRTQQRGKLRGYSFEYLQSWMAQDSNAGNIIMPVYLEGGNVIPVSLKDLVLLKAFTNNTQLAIQLIIKPPVQTTQQKNEPVRTRHYESTEQNKGAFQPQIKNPIINIPPITPPEKKLKNFLWWKKN